MNDHQSPTDNTKPRPQRAVTMTLIIGADTRRDMSDALEQLAFDIAAGQINGPSGCSGGSGSGYSYSFSAKDGPTHDEYVAQLAAYLETKK
jgi:hypothetical protein